MLRMLVLLAQVFIASASLAAQESVFTSLTADQLEGYQFDQSDTPFRVTQLNVGQRTILDSQRRLISDLMLRHLGTSRLKGDIADLDHFQA